MIHYGDITKISGYDVPIVDCIIGGSPCQDLSVAGKRAGLDGERSGLFMEQIRITKEMRERDERNGKTGEHIRPRFLVWENVPGAFSSNKGQDFRIVLEEIAKVVDKDAVIPMPPKDKWTTSGCIMGDGWSIAWRILDAQFWGVPQRRRRISLVADFGGGCASEILFVRKGLRGDSSESKTEKQSPSEDAQGCIGVHDTDGKSYGFPYGVIFDARGNGDGEICCTLTGGHQSTISDYTAIVCEPVKCYDIGDRRSVANESVDVSPTLLSKMGTGGNNVPVIMEQEIDSNYLDVEMEVAVRKYEVDCNALSECLRKHKESLKLSNKHIAESLDRTITEVEHWFRNDKYFSIPSPDIWYDLKEMLGIKTDEFDKSIMKFEFKGGNYDMRNRIYTGNTSPTLKTDCGNALHLVPIVEGLDAYNQSLTGEKTMTLTNCATDYTLNTVDRPAVVYNGANITSPINKTNPQIGDACHTLSQDNRNYLVETKPHYIVRRLTPLECERLQGFPDGWTDIGEYTDSKGKKKKTSDSARYKALGNSIALPPWKWVIKRLCSHYERDVSMASLFDGIGGFPVLWEQINGKGSCLWASEIEDFPIAVTKVRIE